MQKITFVLGGARSGKSTFALREASEIQGRKAFIATAEGLDSEMTVRINNHRKERGKDWTTFEEPRFVSRLLLDLRGRYDVILIDCLTLWISNIMHGGIEVERAVNEFTESSYRKARLLYIVSNEVGMGMFPYSELARVYRDNLGYANRKVAEAATDVYFMAAGIPLKIKESIK
jgi:adenosylcobinamide kinase/adenosylcobinamide-phosphate guanylyltransferase